jgi:NADH-quinone oxidoreductase subunit J
MSNTHLIGKIIYTDYIFAFEVAGLVLLVAIVAAIGLTVREPKDSKRQDVSKQVAVRAKDRVRIVKMAAVVEVPEEPEAAPADAAAAAPAAPAAGSAPAAPATKS